MGRCQRRSRSGGADYLTQHTPAPVCKFVLWWSGVALALQLPGARNRAHANATVSITHHDSVPGSGVDCVRSTVKGHFNTGVRPQQLLLPRAHECIDDALEGAGHAPRLAWCVARVTDIDSDVQLSTGSQHRVTRLIHCHVSLLSGCEG